MSVLRQPEVLGRTTRRRVVGVTAALSAAAVETVAVGCWFGLVVSSRTTATALAGLGVLFCGSLLRTAIFGVTVSDLGARLQPQQLGVTVALTAGWIVWLLVAELIGESLGVAVAAVVFAGMLTGQFVLERHTFRQPTDRWSFTLAVPGLLLAAGASILLRPSGLPTGRSPRRRTRLARRRSSFGSEPSTSAYSPLASSRSSPISAGFSAFSIPDVGYDLS